MRPNTVRFNAASSVWIGPRIGGRGSKYYTSGWLFNTSRKFVPEKSVLSSELPLTPEEYRVELDVPGSGRIELPGYRLKNGVLFLYITPSYRFLFPSDVMTAGGLEDYAHVSLKPSENGFAGEIGLSLRKAGYAEVAIEGKMVEDIVFFDGEPGKFSYRFIDEPVLIISHEKVLGPPKLQKALNGLTIVSGHGKFVLRLRVGKAKEEMGFTVGFGME
ncbi:hypothetical protein APY94_06945 [Thermococcus celericrescens]|uniref:Uncharacterized protein n=1 Tax=Thermococcus celericrescens TaxID=227598 RepID=A0A117ITB5_9EURY|nr:hypothetical protein [Thermococcus celericrescens]KUH33247.1 hypothetical protein APY94_06945 [Thermococcus celericrescens]